MVLGHAVEVPKRQHARHKTHQVVHLGRERLCVLDLTNEREPRRFRLAHESTLDAVDRREVAALVLVVFLARQQPLRRIISTVGEWVSVVCDKKYEQQQQE